MRFSRDYLLRPEDVSAVLGAAPKTLANWRCERQGPPFIMIGRRVYYPLELLNDWLDRRAPKQPKGKRSNAGRK
jgi:hypothetical protein